MAVNTATSDSPSRSDLWGCLTDGPERFTFLPESNSYRCPAGQPLNFVGLNVRNRTHAYIGSRKRCGACSQKAKCTTGQYKYLAIHIHEPARQRARDLACTPGFTSAQRERKKVEALFAELKNQIGLRRLRLRRVCSRAVLPGCGCAKPQALGPLPQPKAAAAAACNDLVVRSQETVPRCANLHSTTVLPSNPFSTPTGDFTHDQKQRLQRVVLRLESNMLT